MALSRDTCVLVCLKAALSLGEAPLVELMTFLEPGVTNLNVFATRCEQGCSSFEFGTKFTAGACRFGLGLLVAFECREQRLNLADSSLLTRDVGLGVVNVLIERFQFGVDRSVLTLGTCEPLRRCAESSIIGVELFRQLAFGVLRRAEPLLGLSNSSLRCIEFSGGCN